MGLTAYMVDKSNIKSVYPSLALDSAALGKHPFKKPSFEKIDADVEKFSDGTFKVTLNGQWFVLGKPRR